jgi:hypothetical protein
MLSFLSIKIKILPKTLKYYAYIKLVKKLSLS